jgi:hypothetical protein
MSDCREDDQDNVSEKLWKTGSSEGRRVIDDLESCVWRREFGGEEGGRGAKGIESTPEKARRTIDEAAVRRTRNERVCELPPVDETMFSSGLGVRLVVPTAWPVPRFGEKSLCSPKLD